MKHCPEWPIKTFFDYNSNSGGKTISIKANNEEFSLSFKQFSRVSTTFELLGSDHVYKIEVININNSIVKTLI